MTENITFAQLWVRSEDLKMLREALCLSQASLHTLGRPDSVRHYTTRLQTLINEIDRHRPLGPDCKHGDRHTPTCGCLDK